MRSGFRPKVTGTILRTMPCSWQNCAINLNYVDVVFGRQQQQQQQPKDRDNCGLSSNVKMIVIHNHKFGLVHGIWNGMFAGGY